jgi:hypothetical protein
MQEMAVEFTEAENYLMHSAEICIITRTYIMLKQQNERYYEELERYTYRILIGKFLLK